MKRLIIYSVLLVSCLFAKAQNPTYNQLLSIVKAKLPNIDLSNKIIAFHVWSAGNNASRETNKEFDKVQKLYEYAKLKNGTKGIVVVSCNVDNVTTGSITAGKDGIANVVSINKNEYSVLSNVSAGTNVVYDNTFSKIYENLSADKIFNTFNQLLTR